ncbi:MAG: ATP-binding protein [Chlamydiae bacterium]|nr:ATP-binding protein [Chlamydiota bacterium]MBI3277781.1 ATP-binding protein [Chlamydiota bacterium]
MNSIRIDFQSDPRWLCFVRGMVREVASAFGLSRKGIQNVTLAVDEACTNIMRHGYNGQLNQSISLECKIKKGLLEILLKDKGKAIDLKKMKSRSLEQVRPGGLGLFFIQQMMDEVIFKRSNGMNILRMVKYGKKK